MRILVGYDGSDCAIAALDDLMQAGLPANAEVHILSVAEVWLPPPPPSAYEVVEQARKAKSQAELEHHYAKECRAAKGALALAEQARDRVQTNFPAWKVTADSSCGSPAWELVAKADQWKPDLIVVGSHGRTALGRFVLGSVSQRVLAEALCSVRISRGRLDEPNSPVRIVVGTDGSAASEKALRAVAARAWPHGSEVMIVLVDDPLAPEFLGKVIPPLGETLEEDRREERAWVERISERSIEILRGADIKVTCIVKEGDPKRELCKAAEEWGADCIFVGSAGFSNRFERFVLGSVSAAVAARAHCSVEVVRQKRDRGSKEGG
ncbi:MAG TPA: universal stress protein [Pyrinomonadaceae bacterium]|nr:universal stress protein [Pyrinomonadaceae bacterium]